jgi:hypothetical protein
MKKFIFPAVAPLPSAGALIGAAPSAHAADACVIKWRRGDTAAR